MYKNILILYSKTKDIDGAVTSFLEDKIQTILKPSVISAYAIEDTAVVPKLYQYDLIFTVGGDGTILRAAHLTSEYRIPLIGVNMGRKGFMAEIEVSDIEMNLYQIKDGKYSIKNYPYIEGVKGDIEDNVVDKGFGLNDILIGKADFLKTISLDLYVDETFVETYICDGLLISTAFGSTAYQRALTGLVVNPNCPVYTITPMGSASKLFSSLAVPDTSRIMIEVSDSKENSKIVVGFDGTQKSFMMGNQDRLEIYKSELNLSLVHLDSYEYYANLRRKLRV